ncbi:hypothetical protein CAPTEDRAFT_216398 [Capitella teleta]|nr:hypothetical protein CAPTEDRAFT_216398 [Capitella teleta]|eukprot:ELU04898.1 hypothetical protein CAPTEDRAFT_216398 [Capitella teleta]
MPIIHFGAKRNKYHRRYARFFGHDGCATPRLAAHALNHFTSWEEKIAEWQQPTLKANKLPAWYKSALFNETYFISDGGSVWVDSIDVKDAVSEHPFVQEFGKFAYLEGHEYRMYNTLDVHYYASFALMKLWPNLQLSLQYDIDNEPWSRLNAYIIHPTNEWKDLNPKFVLQVYRDYVFTKDEQYLYEMYPQCKAVMDHSLRWDVDRDGIIDNSGFADQTYDAWTVTGASAYCGGLWLAAVKAFTEMAHRLGVVEDLMKYEEILERGKKNFEEKLWNGWVDCEYYNYDCSESGHHDSIMADQMCGQWFLKACGVADNAVFPSANVKRALEAVFKHNVLPFDGGRMGAINGMRPNAKKDVTSCQSDEFWTGVTYALGATMIQVGMIDKGFQTAYGAYHTCWERYGLAFQTPEAYFDNRRFRSLGYMRPLAIWAIQHAVEKFHPQFFENPAF